MDPFPILSHPVCIFLFSMLWLYRVGSFILFVSAVGSLCSFHLGVKRQSTCVLFLIVLLSTLLAISTFAGISTLVLTMNPPTPLLIGVSLISSLIAVCQYCMPFYIICMVIRASSLGINTLHNLYLHYRVALMNVCIWLRFTQLKWRWFIVTIICMVVGIVSAFGIGVPLLMSMMPFKRFYPISYLRKHHFVLHADNIPYIAFGENNGDGSTVGSALTLRGNNRALGTTIKRPLSNITGKENTCCGENPPPPKRGRKSNKNSGHRCGSCTVWLQTGSNPELSKHHKMVIGRVHHPGDRAVEFTSFLRCNGAYSNITLRSDSCLCDACYRDCVRASGKP